MRARRTGVEKAEEFAEPWEGAETPTPPASAPRAVGDSLILRAARESGGAAVTVTEEEMEDWTLRKAPLGGRSGATAFE